MSSRSEEIKNLYDDGFHILDLNKDNFVKNPGKDFTRNRKLSFRETMHAVCCMQGGSLRKELVDLYPDIEDRMTPSALVQARDKIKPKAFNVMFGLFNLRSEKFDDVTYKGYKLFAIDGTTFNLPLDPEAETYVGESNPDYVGYNQVHATALYDVCNKTYKDIEIQPQPQNNEIGALKAIVKRSRFQSPSILLADRGFGGFSVFETINRCNNLEYLIRVRNSLTKETRDLPFKEVDIDCEREIRTTQTNEDKEAYRTGKAVFLPGASKFKKKKQRVTWEYESPFVIKFRIVRFQLSTGEYETVITSLDRDKFPIEVIKELYAMRWGIETSFREIKYGIGLSRFHGKKDEFILQEIYAGLLMYNLSMRIAMGIDVCKHKENKHKYVVNRIHAIYVCKRLFWRNLLEKVEAEIRRCINPLRPNRADKRKQVVDEDWTEEYAIIQMEHTYEGSVKRKVVPKSFVPYAYRVA